MQPIKYYAVSGPILTLNELTFNRTLYNNSFAENVIKKIRGTIYGWVSHWNSNPQKAKLRLEKESFKIEGGKLWASGYVKYDEDTKELIDDVKSGFRDSLPVSISSQVSKFVRTPTDEGYRLEINDGELVRVDIVSTASSHRSHLKIDFDSEKKTFEAFNGGPDVFNESASSDGFIISEGKPLNLDDKRFEESLEVTQVQEKTDLKAEEGKEESKLKESEKEVKVMPDNSKEKELDGLFDEDIKAKEDSELAEFRKQKLINTHEARVNGVLGQAKRAFSKEGADAISRYLSLALESAASATKLAVYELSDTQVAECARQARANYMKESQDNGTLARELAANDRSAYDILSPNCKVANDIIQGLNNEGTFGQLPSWADMLKNPAVRSFLIENKKEHGRAIEESAKRYLRVVNAYETIVKPYRMTLESQGYYLDENQLDPRLIHQMESIEGIERGSPTDGDYNGSPSVWAELNSCTVVTLMAICLQDNPLLKKLKAVTGNTFARNTFTLCYPDTQTIEPIEVSVKCGEIIEVESNGLMDVSVLHDGELIPLSSVFGTDYITSQSGNGDGFIKLMISNPTLFDEYGVPCDDDGDGVGVGKKEVSLLAKMKDDDGGGDGDGDDKPICPEGMCLVLSIRSHQPVDPCGVPVLIDVKRDTVTVNSQFQTIAIPECREAMAAMMTNYGVNLVKQAMIVALQSIMDYWNEVLMKEIQMAANSCLAVETEALLANISAGAVPPMHPQAMIPTWNATSVPMYPNDETTDQSYLALIDWLHNLRDKCDKAKGINSRNAAMIVAPSKFLYLLTGWAANGDLVNMNGTINVGQDGIATHISTMEVVESGEMEVQTLTYNVGGVSMSTDVLVGTLYLLSKDALYGSIKTTKPEDRGRISRVTRYSCPSDESYEMIIPTGRSLTGITSKVIMYADPAGIAALRVVIPIKPSNNCGTRTTPRLSQLS